MDERRLRTYLNDHLAGATGAWRVLVRLAGDHAGDDLGGPLVDLRDQIGADRDVLRDALRRLPDGESVWKRALGAAVSMAAWGRQLLPAGPRPSLAEELEVLAIGVWGKRLLWGTLMRVRERDPRFADLDLDDLAARAEAQEKEILRLRNHVLAAAFDLDAAAQGGSCDATPSI